MTTPDRILAIEAAIGGGSIALLEHGRVLAKWHSEENVARSEVLLSKIADLLKEADTGKSELTKIAVSNGPGSYTGIRIGLSTAMGLARSLGIPCAGVSALRAISMNSSPPLENTVVVPIGRDGYCRQTFRDGGQAGGIVQTGDLEALVRYLLSADRKTSVVAHRLAFVTLSNIESISGITDAGLDLAVDIGLAATRIDDGLQPFYARDIPIQPAGEKI